MNHLGPRAKDIKDQKLIQPVPWPETTLRSRESQPTKYLKHPTGLGQTGPGNSNLIEFYLGVPFCKTSFSCTILYQNEPNHSLKLTVTSKRTPFSAKNQTKQKYSSFSHFSVFNRHSLGISFKKSIKLVILFILVREKTSWLILNSLKFSDRFGHIVTENRDLKSRFVALNF